MPTRTILFDAFQRAADKRTLYQAPQKRTDTVRQTLAEDRARYEAMDDDDLAFEVMTLAEEVESIRTELRLEQEGEVERPTGWRPRAERAVNLIRTRTNLCRNEQQARQRAAAEQRRLDELQRRNEDDQRRQEQKAKRQAAHQELLQTDGERKLERLEAVKAAREANSKPRLFVQMARTMLPPDTFMAIWNAVDEHARSSDLSH